MDGTFLTAVSDIAIKLATLAIGGGAAYGVAAEIQAAKDAARDAFEERAHRSEQSPIETPLTDEERARLAYHAIHNYTMDATVAINTPILEDKRDITVTGGQPPIDPSRPQIINPSAYIKYEAPDTLDDDSPELPDKNLPSNRLQLSIPESKSAQVVPNPVEKGNSDALIKVAAVVAALAAEKSYEDNEESKAIEAQLVWRGDYEGHGTYVWVFDGDENEQILKDKFGSYETSDETSDDHTPGYSASYGFTEERPSNPAQSYEGNGWWGSASFGSR